MLGGARYALRSIVAISTQFPPFCPLRLDLRQSALSGSMAAGQALWSIVVTSTHSPPFSPLRLDLRHVALVRSIVPPPCCE